jgi:5-methylcytosine-specific restriction endonuclease McrA
LVYQASNLKRRATKKRASLFLVTAKDLLRVLSRGCFYCDNTATQIDHVVPLSRGGSHSVGNIVGSCERCNKQKGSKFIAEWRLG